VYRSYTIFLFYFLSTGVEWRKYSRDRGYSVEAKTNNPTMVSSVYLKKGKEKSQHTAP